MMKSSASPWIVALGLAIFFGCMEKEEARYGQGGKPAGSAEIRLPALSAGLPARPARYPAHDIFDPMYILTISGPGMADRKQAWPLSLIGGKEVRIHDIPAGERIFRGELEVGGRITHADSNRAAIEDGRVTRITLNLKSSGREDGTDRHPEGLALGKSWEE